MSVVSFKTAMPTVTPPASVVSSSTPASGGSNMGKYLLYGAIIIAVGYGVYKFVIEPRMKANKEYDDD